MNYDDGGAPEEHENERQYLDLLQRIRAHGTRKKNRTGIDTLSVFGAQMRFDLRQGFPLVTTKKISWKWVLRELLWFISGEHNAKPLEDQGCDIWKEWGDPVTREVGPTYGFQWRHWGGFQPAKDVRVWNPAEGVFYSDPTSSRPASFGAGSDQLQEAIDLLKRDPDSRRNIVTAWDPICVPHQALPPCHVLFQLAVNDGRVDCHMFQRSADMFLGVPYNIASYAMLTEMVAKLVGKKPGDLIISLSDAHVYVNHLDAVDKQLRRVPKKSPSLHIGGWQGCVDDFKFEDFRVESYDPWSAIKGEVAV